ncbi:MAG: BTAD domain-containing putative transcriptional regulator [Vulcanimicrobiota bacterium]
MLAKIRTTVPRPQPDLLVRSELLERLQRPIVVLHAPAGYGKTQLLAAWLEQHQERRTVGYLALSRLGETASSLLELMYVALARGEQFQQSGLWQEQADGLLEILYSLGPVTLVVDDVHYLEAETSQADDCALLLSYLLDYRPPECSWIFSGRSKPRLADLELKSAMGEVETLGPGALSLTREQLEEMAPGRGEELHRLTSGWPMACTVLLKSDPAHWSEQRERLGQSLLKLATASLGAEAVDALTVLGLVGWADRSSLERHQLWDVLEPLTSEQALVQRSEDDRLSLHPMFCDHYREEAGAAQRNRAAALLSEGERAWEALEFLSEQEELTEHLLQQGGTLLKSGRYRLLEKLLERAQWHPQLAVLRGRLKWYQGDPAAALECFQQSAQAALAQGQNRWAYQAWRAAGQLYIDAVCPTEAVDFLKKAYRALGPGEHQEKAEVLELLAENAVNLGQAALARRYRGLARRWVLQKPEDLAITARLLLRSGKLTEARGAAQVAREQATREEGPLEGHRDPRLVLSYLLVLEGLPEKALTLADEVLLEAEESEDRRTQSAALTRKAHACLLLEKGPLTSKDVHSLALYTQADSLAKTLGVARLRAEPLMGIALYHIHTGNTPRAYEACREGVEIARQSGDEWLSSWLRFVRAVAALSGQHPSGQELLEACRLDFKHCRDRFGFALCDVWQAVHGKPASALLARHLEEFTFLRERASLFAPPPAEVVKLSPAHREEEAPRRLQVFCLGPLSILRDGEAIPGKSFKRKKARELFVLLLASPDTFFHREELAAQLWPEAGQKAALRDFRVALHALSEALEPGRPKNTTAFCIERQEERYRLLSDKLNLDTSRFELLAESEEPENWEKAVRLYRGPFCEDYPYLEILAPIRRRYDELYMGVAERLAESYLAQGKAPAAGELAQKVLACDPTWEPAYRVLMKSQHQLGHEHLLPRTFTRCLETLEEELGVEPGEETFELARELLGDGLATLL